MHFALVDFPRFLELNHADPKTVEGAQSIFEDEWNPTLIEALGVEPSYLGKSRFDYLAVFD